MLHLHHQIIIIIPHTGTTLIVPVPIIDNRLAAMQLRRSCCRWTCSSCWAGSWAAAAAALMLQVVPVAALQGGLAA